MYLKLRNLEVFHAVMETGSVSKAAERLGLTQPAVSMALTRLEETVGYALFNRSKGHFVPKPEARLLHDDAELAIMAFERFASHAALIGRGAEGLVRIGSIGSTSINFMPELISRFTADRAQVEIELQVRSSGQIAYLVSNSQLDIGIVEGPVAAESLSVRNVSVPCVCVVPADDPLATKDVLTPPDLAGRRLISVFEDHPLDRRIRNAFVQAGLPWKSQIRSYFFAMMRNLVAKGAGVAIIDAINGCAEIDDGVTWRPFEPELRFEMSVITQRDKDLTSPAQDFHDLVMASLRQFEAPVRRV